MPSPEPGLRLGLGNTEKSGKARTEGRTMGEKQVRSKRPLEAS